MSTRSDLALGAFLFLLTGWAPSGLAAPERSQSAPAQVSSSTGGTPGEVAFPAADGVRARAVRTGPDLLPPTTDGIGTALLANDIVAFDITYTGSQGAPSTTGGAFLNLSVRNGGTGTESVLASSSAGSGYTYYNNTGGTLFYTPNENEIAVSPAGLVYYVAQHIVTAGSTAYRDVVEINPVSGVRRLVSDGSNASLGTVPSLIVGICYDYSTASLLISTSGGTNPGIYRVDIATGVRTLVMLHSTTANGVSVQVPQYLTTDPFGNIFYIDYTSGNNALLYVVQIPVTADSSGIYGSRKYVGSNNLGAQNSAPFNQLVSLQIDNTQSVTLSGGLPTNEYLIVTDEGDDQSSSDIYRIPVATGDHVRLINSATNTGSAIFDLPENAQIDTTGRIYYAEYHNFANGSTSTNNTGNVIPAGSRTNTILSGVQNLGNSGTIVAAFRIVPPPTPALAAGTTSSLTGTTVTLNSNVTADGGVQNSGIFQRGFVYSTTATNNAPRIGGTGVTQVSTLSLTSLPITQGTNLGAFTTNVSGLTSGVSYTFSAYARNVSGVTYTAPVTFTTATAPSVTTNNATNLTGTSATLNGNVTADGGASVTARGFVYSSTNTTPVLGGTGVANVPDATATTGAFADSVTGLVNNTTYYFRAYATNTVGTTYGSVLSFRTIAPPTANSQSVNVGFNSPVAVTLTGSDPNTPTQSLSYTVTSAPSHGTLSGTAPNLTYTPTTGYNGADSFTFTTTNTSGLTSNTATVTLNVAAGTPTANSQTVNVPFNTATPITLTGSDPDVPAKSLTYSVVTAPTRGTLTGTAPNLTYTPNANNQGADSFTFRVSNGTNSSNTATVSITVAAGTPTANAQSVSVPFNTATTFTLTGTDPNSPALALTYSVTTAPTHGVLSGTAPNITYTPTGNYQGADSFTFTVSNGQRTSTAATVSFTVAAGTPTATAQSVNVNLNQARALTLAGTDPDSPALPLTYTVVTAPANGTLSGTAPNLTYTPSTGFVGSDSFTFTVSNGQKTSTAATVSLTVIGQPTITSFTPASGPVGTLVTITGTNLQNATGINFFRNLPGTSFTVVSSTQVTVRVPAGAATGTLTLLSGSGSNSSSTKFTVTP